MQHSNALFSFIKTKFKKTLKIQEKQYSRDGVRTESGPKKSGFSQIIKVRTLRTKVRTLNGP